MSVNMKSLIGKLNDATRGALEGAAGLCLARTHYDIEIEHFLAKLLDSSASDASKIFHQFSVDSLRLEKDLGRSLDKLKAGNARTPAFSPTLVKMLTEAWTLGSLDYGASQIRSGHTILALVSNDELRRIAREVSKEFEKIDPAAMKKDFVTIVEGSAEDTAAAEAADEAEGAPTPKAGGKTPNLDQFTVNLTENARKGKIDPVL